jgi:hypothetical protein
MDINAIKTLNGEFTKEDLESELLNLYFSKVIIDITAIKNYADYNYLFNFLNYFDKSKVIILLNDSQLVNSREYLSKLVSEGFYNFTRNAQGINYLIEHPNELKDVEKYLIPNTFANPLFESNATSEIQNETSNNSNNRGNSKNPNQKVIGIQNLTSHAGSTTLMYMLVKQLKINYKVQGIEMNTQDYIYFREPNIIPSTSLEDLKMKIKTYTDKEVIIIDLNAIDGSSVCDEILYLVEPGIVKLNKLMKSNQDLNAIMKKGKIILNRSSIKDEEISNFEYETKLKVFFNLGNFNDRKERIQIIDNLLVKLGFKKQGKGLFGSLR